jgi:glycosyltransferase involved in cell wall biosynthesis
VIGWKPFSWDSNIASARLRCFVPCEQLKQAGWPSELFKISRLNDYQAVVFQKAYTAEDVRLARQLKARNAKVIFDLCDNHFYKLTRQPGSIEQLRCLEQMVELADAVSVSTPKLAELVSGKPTVVVDDAMEDFPSAGWRSSIIRTFGLAHQRLSARTRLVWFGNAGMENPSFGLIDLAAIIPELNGLNTTHSVSLTVISNSRKDFIKHTSAAVFPVCYCKWRRETFKAIFQRHDICVLPVLQNPFTICKTNNRLLLSLRLGVAVVAGKIPSYEEFSGFVPFDDWQKNLRTYVENSNLRRQNVAAAQRYIAENYPPLRAARQWEAFLKSVLA